MNTILNWVERCGGWFPCVAGFLTGFGAGWVVQGAPAGWSFLGCGLAMAAIRPAGTSLRRRRLIRQVRAQIAEHERQVR